MVGLPRTQESQFMYEMILLMDAYDYHMLNNISHKDWIELTLDEKSSIIAGYLIELKVMKHDDQTNTGTRTKRIRSNQQNPKRLGRKREKDSKNRQWLKTYESYNRAEYQE